MRRLVLCLVVGACSGGACGSPKSAPPAAPSPRPAAGGELRAVRDFDAIGDRAVTDQTNLRDARIARIRDIPRKLHTELIASTEPPGGVGEPGVPPVGPALANAVFALTGKRIREIPIANAVFALTGKRIREIPLANAFG